MLSERKMATISRRMAFSRAAARRLPHVIVSCDGRSCAVMSHPGHGQFLAEVQGRRGVGRRVPDQKVPSSIRRERVVPACDSGSSGGDAVTRTARPDGRSQVCFTTSGRPGSQRWTQRRPRRFAYNVETFAPACFVELARANARAASATRVGLGFPSARPCTPRTRTSDRRAAGAIGPVKDAFPARRDRRSRGDGGRLGSLCRA